MQNERAQKKGFTIIELLVAIVIIGILASIMIVSYTGIQQRSRDSERTSHTTQIKLALEKYRAEMSMYPAVCSGDNVGCRASLLAAPLAPYLSIIPNDPRNPVDSATDYRYVRGSLAQDSYAILINYEARSVCKTGQNIQPTWWSTTFPSC